MEKIPNQEKPTVYAVVPVYNEEKRIGKTISRIPRSIVDSIIVVDDCSTDNSRQEALNSGAHIVISHHRNRGCGASIRTGYKESLRRGADIVVVLPGDNQSDPSEIPRFLELIVNKKADFVMGDRQLNTDIPKKNGMPLSRRIGLRMLAWLTGIVSGVKVPDSQCGITAISSDALEMINLDYMSDRWGYNNDMIFEAAMKDIRMYWVPASYNYRISRQSYIRLIPYIFRVSTLLYRNLLRRLFYVNSLWTLSFPGMILMLLGIGWGVWIALETVAFGILGVRRIRSVTLAIGMVLSGLIMSLFGSLMSILRTFEE